jgi:cytochrome c553
VIWILSILFAAQAQTPSRAATCIACHGNEGRSVNDLWPNLAGQKAAYIRKQLEAFRSGVRQDPLMSPIARTLSEQEIAELATYFAAVKP